MKKVSRIFLLFFLLAGLSAVLMFRIRGLRELGLLPPSGVSPTGSIEVASSPLPSAEPTPEPAPLVEARDFTISIIGDQTLTSHQFLADSSPYSFAGRMNGDFSYPFSRTAEYFLSDDYTITNLECTLSDSKLKSAMQFYFKAPTSYASILTEGGVDFVTTANNHMLDFGEQGLTDTYAALEANGIPYGKEDDAQLVTTDSGLVLGIYCAYNDLHPDAERAADAIRKLRENGAEYVICCYHWGQELYYHPNQGQIDLAHASIDAGADLIYGTHTHCLQPVETYNGGIILYSMGEFSFGGNTEAAAVPKTKTPLSYRFKFIARRTEQSPTEAIVRFPAVLAAAPSWKPIPVTTTTTTVPHPIPRGQTPTNVCLASWMAVSRLKAKGGIIPTSMPAMDDQIFV